MILVRALEGCPEQIRFGAEGGERERTCSEQIRLGAEGGKRGRTCAEQIRLGAEGSKAARCRLRKLCMREMACVFLRHRSQKSARRSTMAGVFATRMR